MDSNDMLRVTLCPDGFYPQALRWQGRTVRVLSVERVLTCGLHRRYRVRTAEGCYEVALHIGTGSWAVRHSPGWLSRLWARMARTPRYALPAWQRRGRRQPPAQQPARTPQPSGGVHAVRLALVRQ